MLAKDPSPHRPEAGSPIFTMTEMTNKPVPRTSVAIHWAADESFDVHVQAVSATDAPLLLAPPLTPNDTGFLNAPPAPI